MPSVKAIFVSRGKGSVALSVEKAGLEEGLGIEGDAHAGPGNRQISILPFEAIEEYRRMVSGDSDAADAEAHGLREKCFRFQRISKALKSGIFGENLIVEGLDLSAVAEGTLFRAGGDAVIQITGFEGQCRGNCDIVEQTGDCVTPGRAMFARVLTGGAVRRGDAFEELKCENIKKISIKERED